MLLRPPNELKPYFPVVFDMNISFLKLVWSSRPFRRLEKTFRAPISENHVFERNSRLRWAMVFLIADSESTQKVTSIANFLTWKHLFVASYRLNPVFGRNPVFAVREQLTDFHVLLTPDSENSGSKVPGVNWNSVFFWSDVRHTLLSFLLSDVLWNLSLMHGLSCVSRCKEQVQKHKVIMT